MNLFRLLLAVLLLMPAWTIAAYNVPNLTLQPGDFVECTDGNTTRSYYRNCDTGWSLVGQAPTPSAGSPVLLFSDLMSGSKTGWHVDSATKGAVVTVWGFNLGTEGDRGANYVSIGGQQLTTAASYVDTWGETSNPVRFLQSITFQLNNLMTDGDTTITVTVDGKTSNALSFNIDSSNIYFASSTASSSGSGTYADPWDCSDFNDTLSAGDVVYFRGGLYDFGCGGKANIYYRDSEPAGTINKRIVLTAYPNETPLFDSNTASSSDANFNKSFNIQQDYITVAKMTTEAWGAAIYCEADGCRAVGNNLEGSKEHVLGEGIIVGGGDVVEWVGNTTWGARSQNRLDHSIYINKCNPQPAIADAVVAYNYSYDNQYDRGPAIVVNLQESRCASNEYNAGVNIHSNWVDCRGGVAEESRGIGIFDVSWSDNPGEPLPGWADVYNNTLVDCGKSDVDGDHAALYHNNGLARFYKNLVYGSKGPATSATGTQGAGLHTSEWRDNIFIVESGADCLSTGAGITFDNNVYRNCSGSLASDVSAITDDPLITVDLDAGVFSVDSNSPLIGAGSAATDSVVTIDQLGTPRDADPDIGPYEYVAPEVSGIIFETDFSTDAGYFKTGQANFDYVDVPAGWDGVRTNDGTIEGVAGAGVDGGVAMRFTWPQGNGQILANSLFKHLTNDEATGYDELYIRYKVRLPNDFKAGEGGEALPFWKWGRLWQNTGLAGSGWTEQRPDSYYIVWNWGDGQPQYGIRNGLTFGENLNTDSLGSAGGPRAGTNWYDNGAGVNSDNIDAHIGVDGNWDNVGAGAWRFDHTTRFLANNTSQTWHTVEWRFKLSSTATANDGEFQVWFDGDEQEHPNVIGGIDQTIDQPSTQNSLVTAALPGFNFFTLFDNLAEWSSDQPTVIYINDVVISTSRITHEYVAGSAQ